MAVFLCLLFIAQMSLLASSGPIPKNWRDYISKDMLEKYQGKHWDEYSDQLFQGDIDGVDKDLSTDDLKSVLNNVITDEKKRWPNGVIPYTLSGQYNRDEKIVEKTLIHQAMDIISSSTRNCIQFIQRTNEEDYIHITRGVDCHSQVGRDGGKQVVSLTRGCLEEIGAIQHELMHALGFYHEQSRADRDQYVWINWENLLPKAKNDFNISTDATTFGLPYDYESILHYGFNAFARISSAPTIIPKEKDKPIGQRINLSVLDILKLRRAYNCPDADEIIAGKIVALGRDTEITEKPSTNQDMSVIATTTAQVETTGHRRNHIRIPRPTPRDLNLPDFKRGSLSDVECKALNTENCFLASWANCSTGHFGFYCNGSSTDLEIRYHLEKIKRAIPSSPITFSIGGKTELNAGTFQSMSDNIVILQVAWTNGFNCDVFRDLPLLNMLFLDFYLSTNITINRDSFRPFQKMRFLEFQNSTIFFLEKGSLESLISLKTVAFDWDIALPFSSEDRSYLRRLHCSAEYSWLRDYLDQHPELIQPRNRAEVYSLPGYHNLELTRRNLSYPVDCSKDDLTGDQNQVEFSLNDESP